MPTLTQYIDHIEFVDRSIKMRIEGLTHADSMKQLSFPANCMNWNIGHIMVFRDVYLGAIDGTTARASGNPHTIRHPSSLQDRTQHTLA